MAAIVKVGSVTGAVGGTQVSSDTQVIREVVVQADPDNTENLFIGNSTTRSIQLNPGAAITLPVRDLSKLYVSSAGGAAVANFLAVD